MGLLTHREKLTQLRHRLSEAQTQQEREEILRLLAKEEAKDGIVAFLLGHRRILLLSRAEHWTSRAAPIL